MRRLPSDMRAQMTYPCPWSYRLIGADQDALRDAAEAVLGPRVCSLCVSNASRTGRYVSVKVEVEVSSQEDRLALFEALRAHPSVVLVI